MEDGQKKSKCLIDGQKYCSFHNRSKSKTYNTLYEKQKAERFYILFLPVRVYVIVQELSTMIVRKIN